MASELHFSAVIRLEGEDVEILELDDHLPAKEALLPVQHELIRLAVRERQAMIRPEVPYRLEFVRERGQSRVSITPLGTM